jgi:hypothetical protein
MQFNTFSMYYLLPNDGAASYDLPSVVARYLVIVHILTILYVPS